MHDDPGEEEAGRRAEAGRMEVPDYVFEVHVVPCLNGVFIRPPEWAGRASPARSPRPARVLEAAREGEGHAPPRGGRRPEGEGGTPS